MDKMELKPCPCGSSDVRHIPGTKNAPDGMAMCKVCGRSDFVHRWNRRPTETALRKRVEELEVLTEQLNEQNRRLVEALDKILNSRSALQSDFQLGISQARSLLAELKVAQKEEPSLLGLVGEAFSKENLVKDLVWKARVCPEDEKEPECPRTRGVVKNCYECWNTKSEDTVRAAWKKHKATMYPPEKERRQ